MEKRKNRKFWESAATNTGTYNMYYEQLAELAISMFKWQNLPETIDPRYLEVTLFTDGQAVFFKDPELGYLGLQCATSGNFNVYRIPIKRRAYATNGYQQELTINDSVIIYNNYMRTNTQLEVIQASKRLYNLDRAIDVNVNAQKTPVLIKCDESQRLTMLNLYSNYEGNQPFIFGDKALNTTGIQALSTQAPYVADKLQTLKTQIWNETLTRLGISNVSVIKKERLVADEVSLNQGDIIANRYSRLNARREACLKINQMFGLNIWCDYREDYQTQQEAYDTIDGRYGDIE